MGRPFTTDRTLDVLLTTLLVGYPLLAAFSLLILLESVLEPFPRVKQLLPADWTRTSIGPNRVVRRS